MTAVAEVHGFVAAGFEPVRTEFERNFTERDELGAAFAVYCDGEAVIDLWGGIADRALGRPWEEGTLQVVFSGTKGVVAVCMLLAIERGLLELDKPVARYWPEFATAGKETITVRDVVSHTARLPGLDEPISVEEYADDRLMASLLARQAPSQDPRAGFCYHALSYGWLCGELIRRVDGRSIGRFFADEVAGPLMLELWIGLPEELEPRVATLELAADWPASSHLQLEALAADELLRSIWSNPPTLYGETFSWNSRAYHAAEIPGAGGIGTARSLARLYGNVDRILSPETIRLGATPQFEGWDEIHGGPRRFGVGFQLANDLTAFGLEPDAFGHGGAGGSSHGAWPSKRIGFSYAMNLMRDDQEVDPRAQALLGALHEAVA